MSIFLVLDVLLVLLVVLFAPIGYWRGPVKELLVMLGVLSGVVLSDYWARPWGHDLSTQTSITADGGAFIVAMAFLVARRSSWATASAPRSRPASTASTHACSARPSPR